jgi:hypothetical protein
VVSATTSWPRSSPAAANHIRRHHAKKLASVLATAGPYIGVKMRRTRIEHMSARSGNCWLQPRQTHTKTEIH